MKTILIVAILSAAALFPWAHARGALVVGEVIHGEALCARCQLKEASQCGIVIRAVESGTNVLYYATTNRVAAKFQPKSCQGTVKVWAKGTVRERDGENQITLKMIDLDTNDKLKLNTP
jgi:hypothetical protein